MKKENELKEILKNLKKLDAPKLKEFWEGLEGWEDKDVEEFRDNFVKLEKLIDLTNNLKSGEMVYIEKYDPSKHKLNEHFIIPFIGKIEDLDGIVKKYLPYDCLIRHYVKENSKVRETVEEYVTGKKSYAKTSGSGNTLFFARLISGNFYGRDIDEPQVQLYSFNLEEIIVKNLKEPWFGVGELLICDDSEDYEVCSIPEFMENADLFIRTAITPSPKFGLDKLNEI